jgi:hypothetical protein
MGDRSELIERVDVSVRRALHSFDLERAAPRLAFSQSELVVERRSVRRRHSCFPCGGRCFPLGG